MSKKLEIIDVKNGDVTGDNIQEIVMLKGEKFDDESTLYKSLELTVQDGSTNKQYILNLDEEGYNLSLYLGDFNGDSKDEIFIYGEKGGTGGYAIGKIYEVIDGNFRVIFNCENFSEEYKYITEYLDNYFVKIYCDKNKKEYKFYIGDNYQGYLEAIYDKNGKVKSTDKPIVSYVNGIYPIENMVEDNLDLLLQQRIVGVANSDIIGAIETIINLKNNVINEIKQYGLTLGKVREVEDVNKPELDAIKKALGREIQFIDLYNFGLSDNLIVKDFDNDGKEEAICFYLKGKELCLSIFRKEKENFNLLDTIGFEGADINDLYIKPIRRREINNIIIGFKKSAFWNNLAIYELKNDKLRNLLKEEELVYSRLEIEPLDSEKRGVNEIICWNHSTGEAYDVIIYSHFGHGIQSTTRYDKLYYPRVEDYYRELITRTRETPTYLYYLADTLYRIGNKRESLMLIERVINSQKPYPSLDEAKKLKKKLLGN